ncbi:hypothetical protein HID58_060461 [Brassica napus]|uniref:Uncharacterized protein n=1 Tax=Brassica napus TaxID=3708 RepID=A0ABQ7ZWU4_BRANA|nr:hypothetical protein HID58_060461 [Brassica napus]
MQDARATDSPLDDFDLIHRDALRDSDNMTTLSQRLLVADAHRMIRDECADRVEVGSSDVSGSSSEASTQASRPLRRVSREVPFDQIDCRATIYHPGGILEELCPLPPELLRDPRAQSWGNSAQAIAAHSHLRWPDLSREWIRRQEARIARVHWESRLPVVLGSRKSRLSLFTRKQQKLLDEARKMDGVLDLSALLKGKLQLLSKRSIPADVQGSTSSDADRASKEGAHGLVNEDVGAEPSASGPKKKKKSNKSRRKAIEELLLEEIASLDETSEGLEASKEKGGRKRPYEGATSSADHGEAPTVGREGAAEGPFESIEAEPRPSDAEAGLVEVVAGGGVSLETPPEERKVSARGSDPVASERSVSDPSAGKGSRSEGSTVRRGKIEFPDRVKFSYNETTPLILNPLRCAELTHQIRGGTKEMPQLDDLYFKNEYIDAASSRARTMIHLGSSEKLAQARLKVIERVRAEHKKANEKAAEEKEILRVKFEELEGKLKSTRAARKELDNPEIGNTPIREKETGNVGIKDPVLVSDSSSEGREGEEEEGDRVEEMPSLQPIEEEKTDEVGNRDVPPPPAVDSLVSIPTRVEDPTVAATEDPVGPSALGTPEEAGQDSAP